MKRARDSRLSETRMIGPSISDLPSPVFVEILLKLPARSVVVCKSVCKAWHGSISDPHFTKLRLARAKPCVLIRGAGSNKFSRSFYLLENGDGRSGLDSGFCGCKARKQNCKNCRFDAEVRFKLKIPLRNPGVMLFLSDNSASELTFCLKATWTSRNLIHLKSGDYYYEVLSSCNGLLCLAERASSVSVCICNPVTGEFTNLPPACQHQGAKIIKIGFGFSPRYNRYKVIRMVMLRKYDGSRWLYSTQAVTVEVHTLGTGLWRSLDISGLDVPTMSNTTYLDGSLYWTLMGGDGKYLLASFDMDEERFHTHSIPSQLGEMDSPPHLQVAVLEGRLFVYNSCIFNSRIDIWVVKERSGGVSFSWTQMFSVDLTRLHASYHSHHNYRLISCLSDQAIVLYGGPRDEFIYYDQSQGFKFKHPKFLGAKSRFDVFVFTPSFVSLKEAAISGSDIKVLNVNSRCGKLKLLEETVPLLLGKTRN